jgi:sugar O-acyltransferase (sialic acid O-acetyltransferase NeuD family)
MSNTKLVIVGTGGLAAECVETIKALKNILVTGFIDDYGQESFDLNKEKYAYQEEYLGKIADYDFQDGQKVLIAFSAPNKIRLFSYLQCKNVDIINLIHPSVKIPDSSQIGVGNIIGANVVIGPNVKIGDGNTLTAYSFVSHDCQIGNFNFFSTAGLSGATCVGDLNFFGIRSTVLPRVSIGNRNTIQAGMVVDKNLADDTTIFYKYKEKITVVKDSGLSNDSL